MADPGGLAWENVELEGRLRERLLLVYDNYLDSMHEISEIMKKLTQEHDGRNFLLGRYEMHDCQ